jgi:catechol 2,3-dioxygenase-like lactoylglutathione lyase family enzyme
MTSEAKDVYWSPLVPELTVANLARSLDFYCAAGFSIRFQRDDPPFAYLELGHAQIMLEQEHSAGWNVMPLDRPLGRGINFQIEVPSAQSIVASLASRGVSLFREPKETWYTVSADKQEGQLEFLVQDPDGYLLRFAEYLGQR